MQKWLCFNQRMAELPRFCNYTQLFAGTKRHIQKYQLPIKIKKLRKKMESIVMRKILDIFECALKELFVKVGCGPAGGFKVTDFLG